MRFGLLLILVALAACGQQSTTPAVVADASQMPADNVVYGVSSVMTREGVRTGLLRGDSAYMYETGRRMDLVGVDLKFFTETGRESGTLTSQTGEYRTDTGSFVARGNVVLITQTPEGGQRRLETEELHYDVKADRIWSDVAFVLHQPNGSRLSGNRFRSDSKFQTWETTGAKSEGGLPSGGGFSF